MLVTDMLSKAHPARPRFAAIATVCGLDGFLKGRVFCRLTAPLVELERQLKGETVSADRTHMGSIVSTRHTTASYVVIVGAPVAKELPALSAASDKRHHVVSPPQMLRQRREIVVVTTAL